MRGPRRRLMTDQQQIAARAVLAGASVTQALAKAGYRSQGGAQCDRVKRDAISLANKLGLTVERGLRTVLEGLDANKTIVTRDGCVDEPHTDARLRAAEITLRIHGVGQQQQSQAGITVIIAPMREHIQDVVIGPRESDAQESCGSQVCEE